MEHHPNYNCQVTTDQGNEYLVYSDWLYNNQLDNFYDWQCEAGVTRIYVDKNLQVFGGECQNDHLGTTNDFNMLQSAVCKQSRCFPCTDDLAVAKQMRA